MERFCQFPDCTDFNLSQKENVKQVIRHHWLSEYFILFQWIFWGPLLFTIVILGLLHYKISFESNTALITLSASILYIIFLTFSYYIKWLNEAFDIIFLTEDRVLDVTQVDFWHRNIIETRLDHIQDATGDIKGVINTLFDWGLIIIRTANDKADFSIDRVHNAHQQAQEIFRLANIARKKEISGISEIKEGEFCPVDFSEYKRKNKIKKREYSKISHSTKSSAQQEYISIKKIFRNKINTLLSKKR